MNLIKNKLFISVGIFLIGLFCHSTASAYIKFIPNQGQWESNILYKADIPGGLMWVEQTGIAYTFYNMGDVHEALHDGKQLDKVKFHVVRIKFPNSTGIKAIEKAEQSSEYYNYFLGNNPAHWATKVHGYRTIVLKDVWEGIDIEMIGQEDGIKYNFIVDPGADPDMIRLKYEGADDMLLEDDELHIHTTLLEIIEDKPVAFQENKEIKASFKLDGNIVTFNLGRYNKSLPLLIDPTVVFATFSGSRADNWGYTATFDADGNAYSGGTVYSTGFPTVSGAFQREFKGGASGTQDRPELPRDAGILKFSPDGKQLLWASYLGGNHNEQPHSMVVNSKGELLVMGTTFSSNFPVTNGVDGTYNGGGDIFAVRISSDGTQLLSGTYIGGSLNDGLNTDVGSSNYFALLYAQGELAFNYGDFYRGEINVDPFDNVYIASCTRSFDFPTQGSIQNFGGLQDACIVKLSPNLDNFEFSSYLGGDSQDAAYGINFDRDSNIVVCGGTRSSNFPTKDGYQNSYKGNIDGFITKINRDDYQIMQSTYLGTDKYDQVYFVQSDDRNKIYVTGQTLGDFPVVGQVFTNDGSGQFITIFENDLRSIYRSTVFGSGARVANISPSAFLVDLCGRIYVSGWGGDVNVNTFHRNNPNANDFVGFTKGMPITEDAYQKASADGSDFYLIIFSPNLHSLEYGSYFGGGKSSEHVDGGTSRFDRDGHVYQSVCGGCGGFSDFPTTEGAWSRENKGRRPDDPEQGGCNNAVFKIDLNSSIYAPEFKDTLLTVTANEELYYTFTITDKDEQDSIYVTYDGNVFDPKVVGLPTAELKVENGKNKLDGYIYWNTSCNQAAVDTYTVNLHIRDNGCPTPRSIVGKIRIVIIPPPPPDPPYVFCLRRLGDSTLKLEWDEFKMDQTVKEYRLVKRSPDGSEDVVKIIKNKTEQTYIDYDAPNHETFDYCYFIYGVNACGSLGDTTRRTCSEIDRDSLPEPVNMHTVTVENNEYLKVVWNKYPKNDFYHYKVYKKENIRDAKFMLYRTIKAQMDTVMYDSSVKVNERSYCYKIIAMNQCGFVSKDGNYGCSILLTGEAIPFINNLNWNHYEQWTNGVERYKIIRRDATPRDDSLIGTTTGNFNYYSDEKLDYDMGLYYYTVEGVESKTGGAAKSLSNTIILIQKPILYVPNAFTPNDDLINDTWNGIPVFVKDYHLKVYNRWGEFVWETDDRHDQWNALGIYRSDETFDNVFIWQARFTGWDGSSHFKHGYVNIIW